MPCAALQCHPATPCAVLRSVHVSLAREPEHLKLKYVLEGDIDRLRIPAPRTPRIAERLWQHTCCEVFLARPGVCAYREFNFSPSREWAAYDFVRYREGSLVADESLDPAIALRKGAARLELAASIRIPEGKLRVGLSAVVEETSGALSYWALRHAPGKPDFHHADAFALEFDEVRH